MYDEEKMAIKESTDEEIAALLVKIELRDKEIAALKEQCEDLRDELDSIVELKDVEEIKLRLLEAELEGGDSDENQLKKVEVLKLACRASALNQDALQEALKDAAVRAQIEVLKKHEGELEAEVDKLRASEDKLHEDEKLHRKFCWSVMINVSKVDPDDVKKEEKRQKGGGVEADEIVGAVRDYVEAAPDDAEIFVRNLQDYVHVRFPFLALTDEHKRIISDTFEDLFKEVPPPTEEELKELERLRLEDEAVDYGYTGKEATGRTAGQLRKMISDARVVARDAKVADRQRRASALPFLLAPPGRSFLLASSCSPPLTSWRESLSILPRRAGILTLPVFWQAKSLGMTIPRTRRILLIAMTRMLYISLTILRRRKRRRRERKRRKEKMRMRMTKANESAKVRRGGRMEESRHVLFCYIHRYNTIFCTLEGGRRSSTTTPHPRQLRADRTHTGSGASCESRAALGEIISRARKAALPSLTMLRCRTLRHCSRIFLH